MQIDAQDNEIKNWFRTRDEMKDAEKRLLSLQTDFANTTYRLAKMLLPEKAQPGERWVYPLVNGKAVVAFFKGSPEYGEDGKESTRYTQTVEEHTLPK